MSVSLHHSVRSLELGVGVSAVALHDEIVSVRHVGAIQPVEQLDRRIVGDVRDNLVAPLARLGEQHSLLEAHDRRALSEFDLLRRNHTDHQSLAEQLRLGDRKVRKND